VGLPDIADAFPISVWFAVIAIAAVAGIVHGTLGLGFPLVATPLLTLFTDIRTAIVFTILPSITVQIISIVRGGNWAASIARFWPMPVYFAAGGYLGTRLLIASDPAPFALLLVAIIFVYLGQERLGRLDWSALSRRPQLFGALFALGAGFFEGTVNASAPPLVIFFMALRLAPTALVQAMNLCFLSGKSMQVLALTVNGGVTAAAWAATLPAVLTGAAALMVGIALRSRVDAETFRAWLRHALLVMAVLLLAQFAHHAWNHGRW